MSKSSGTVHIGTDALVCPVEQSSTGFRYTLALLVATLREIFDESAYQRFLTQHHLDSGAVTYGHSSASKKKRKLPTKMLLVAWTPPSSWIGWMFRMSEPAISVQALANPTVLWKPSKRGFRNPPR